MNSAGRAGLRSCALTRRLCTRGVEGDQVFGECVRVTARCVRLLPRGSPAWRSSALHQLSIDYIEQARLAMSGNGASGSSRTDPASGGNLFQGIRCIVDISLDTRRRRAIVEFDTAIAAQAALYHLTGSCLMERPIKFAWFDRSRCDLDRHTLPRMKLLPDRVPRTVLVEGFDTSASIPQIRHVIKAHFDPAGQRGGRIITPKSPDGTSTGKAFVCFRRFRDLRAALKRDGLNLGDGHRLRVTKWVEVLSFPWNLVNERGSGADAPNRCTLSTGCGIRHPIGVRKLKKSFVEATKSSMGYDHCKFPRYWTYKRSIPTNPPMQNDGSCAIVSLCITVEMRYHVEQKKKRTQDKIEVDMTWVKKICKKAGIYTASAGSSPCDVLDVIMKMGGMLTRKHNMQGAEADRRTLIPVQDYGSKSMEKTSPSDIIYELYVYGPVVGALNVTEDYSLAPEIVYRGCPMPLDGERHFVVCYGYQWIHEKLHLEVLDK